MSPSVVHGATDLWREGESQSMEADERECMQGLRESGRAPGRKKLFSPPPRDSTVIPTVIQGTQRGTHRGMGMGMGMCPVSQQVRGGWWLCCVLPGHSAVELAWATGEKGGSAHTCPSVLPSSNSPSGKAAPASARPSILYQLPQWVWGGQWGDRPIQQQRE